MKALPAASVAEATTGLLLLLLLLLQPSWLSILVSVYFCSLCLDTTIYWALPPFTFKMDKKLLQRINRMNRKKGRCSSINDTSTQIYRHLQLFCIFAVFWPCFNVSFVLQLISINSRYCSSIAWSILRSRISQLANLNQEWQRRTYTQRKRSKKGGQSPFSATLSNCQTS